MGRKFKISGALNADTRLSYRNAHLVGRVSAVYVKIPSSATSEILRLALLNFRFVCQALITT